MQERVERLLAEVRQLTDACHTPGDRDCFEAFRDLTQRILTLTVAQPGHAVSLVRTDARTGRALVVSGTRNDTYAPLRLTNGGFLNVFISLDNRGDQGYLRVIESKFQYAIGPDKADWVFRYDFLRSPKHRYPPAHLQINGTFAAAMDRPLPHLHFPVGRPTIEAVARLLVEQCEVPCNEHKQVWRPVLAASERAFLDAAYQPLSGPAAWDEDEDDRGSN